MFYPPGSFPSFYVANTDKRIMADTTIATAPSQTSLALTGGPPDDDALNGCFAIIRDQTTVAQKSIVAISDYVGSTRTVTLVGAPKFTVVAGDLITVFGVELSGTKVAGTLGDVEGKVLGGTAGGGTITGTGAHVLDANGAAVATAASQSIIAGIIDTEVADILAAVNAIKAKTDNLPSDPGDASDIAASLSALSSTLATVATYIDTEVAAIKAKTDRLPSITAGQTGGVALVGSVMSISPASLQQASSQDGSTLLIIRGDAITVPFENLGNISDRVDIFFTIKNETTDADTDALVQVSEEAGLLRIAGDAPGSAAYAEIIVDDENAGDGRILIYPPASGLLSRGSRKPTDIQIVRDPDTNVQTFLYRANIVNDVTIRRE
jgi:hypothetical protein